MLFIGVNKKFTNRVFHTCGKLIVLKTQRDMLNKHIKNTHKNTHKNTEITVLQQR